MVSKETKKIRVNHEGKQRTIKVHQYLDHEEFRQQYLRVSDPEDRPWYTRKLGVVPRAWSTDSTRSIYISPLARKFTDYETLLAHEIGHQFGYGAAPWWKPTTMNPLPFLRWFDTEGLLSADITKVSESGGGGVDSQQKSTGTTNTG